MLNKTSLNKGDGSDNSAFSRNMLKKDIINWWFSSSSSGLYFIKNNKQYHKKKQKMKEMFHKRTIVQTGWSKNM